MIRRRMNPYLIYGLWVLAVALWLTSMYVRVEIVIRDFENTAIPVKATVKSVNIHSVDDDGADYKIELSYFVNGSMYDSHIYSPSDSYTVGDTITIYCKPSEPLMISRQLNQTGLFMLVPLMIVTYTVSSYYIGTYIYIKKKAKRLKANGRRIIAYVSDFYEDDDFIHLFKHPYIVKCCYDKNDVPGLSPGFLFGCNFMSDHTWVNPEKFRWHECPVYINPKNPRDYYVDLSWLENYKK